MGIAAKRKEKNITQHELAKKLNVSPAAVAMWETGARKPRADKLIALSVILDCSIDELLKPDAVEQEG